MIPTAKEVLALASSYVGYKEKKTAENKYLDSFTANAGSANYTKFQRDTNGFWGNKQGFEWCTSFPCAMFLYAVSGKQNFTGATTASKQTYYDQIKQIQPFTKYGASCKYQTAAYKNAKRWSDTPHVGDQAFFTRGHTGLVEKFDGKKLTLIEGNSNNKVERRTYNFPNSIFSGFGRPAYAAEPVKEEPKKPASSVAFKPYKAKVTPSNGLNVRTGPATSYKKLGAMKMGTVITILEEKNGWGRHVFNGKAGWSSLNYLRKV